MHCVLPSFTPFHQLTVGSSGLASCDAHRVLDRTELLSLPVTQDCPPGRGQGEGLGGTLQWSSFHSDFGVVVSEDNQNTFGNWLRFEAKAHTVLFLRSLVCVYCVWRRKLSTFFLGPLHGEGLVLA